MNAFRWVVVKLPIKIEFPNYGPDIFHCSVISDKLQEQLRTIITAPVEDSDIEPFKMVKRLYQACINKRKLFVSCIIKFLIWILPAALIEERGLKPLLDIHEKLGGWPVIKGDAWDEKSWSWQKSVKDFRKLGYSTDYILDFSVGTDLKNSTRRIVDVSAKNFFFKFYSIFFQ